MHNNSLIRSYSKLKLTLLILLTANSAIYAIVDTWTSAIDAMAWLTLLIMFELETFNGQAPFADGTLHAIRNTLMAAIVLAFVGYLHDNEWVDVTNSLLWFALVILLELEMRCPDKVERFPRTFWLTTLFAFAGIVAMIGIWIWQKAWLDAYDAALWLAAFATIEVDVFRILQRKRR